MLIQSLTFKIFNNCYGATGTLINSLWGFNLSQPLSKTVWQLTTCTLGNKFLSQCIYPTKCVLKHPKRHIQESLFIINPTWRQSTCLLTVNEWTMEYSYHDILYSNENQLLFHTIWVNLTNTMLHKRSQTENMWFFYSIYVKFRIRQNDLWCQMRGE